MDTKKKYWFKDKKYGWGWGLPLTWQGWVSYGVFVGVWLLALADYVPRDASAAKQHSTTFLVVMALDVFGLIFVAFKFGEPPAWHWGNKKLAKAKKSKKA